MLTFLALTIPPLLKRFKAEANCVLGAPVTPAPVSITGKLLGSTLGSGTAWDSNLFSVSLIWLSTTDLKSSASDLGIIPS